MGVELVRVASASANCGAEGGEELCGDDDGGVGGGWLDATVVGCVSGERESGGGSGRGGEVGGGRTGGGAMGGFGGGVIDGGRVGGGAGECVYVLNEERSITVQAATSIAVRR